MITITLHREYELWDLDRRRARPDLECALVEAGTYEARRIPSPDGDGESWLVLTIGGRETRIGQPERCWRFWTNPNLGRDRIDIVEERDAAADEPVTTRAYRTAIAVPAAA